MFLDNTLRYTTNGILHMLDRNRRIKPRPERFQTCDEKFDIIVSCEERVYDQILEGTGFSPPHPRESQKHETLPTRQSFHWTNAENPERVQCCCTEFLCLQSLWQNMFEQYQYIVLPAPLTQCSPNYGSLTADLEARDKQGDTPVHVINIDIQDNHEEATIGAFMICDMCTLVSTSHSQTDLHLHIFIVVISVGQISSLATVPAPVVPRHLSPVLSATVGRFRRPGQRRRRIAAGIRGAVRTAHSAHRLLLLTNTPKDRRIHSAVGVPERVRVSRCTGPFLP